MSAHSGSVSVARSRAAGHEFFTGLENGRGGPVGVGRWRRAAAGPGSAALRPARRLRKGHHLRRLAGVVEPSPAVIPSRCATPCDARPTSRPPRLHAAAPQRQDHPPLDRQHRQSRVGLRVRAPPSPARRRRSPWRRSTPPRGGGRGGAAAVVDVVAVGAEHRQQPVPSGRADRARKRTPMTAACR